MSDEIDYDRIAELDFMEMQNQCEFVKLEEQLTATQKKLEAAEAKLAKVRQETLREVRALIKDNCWNFHDRDLDCRCDEIAEKLEAEREG